MFFPLHDQKNEAVKAVPIVSYTIIGICLVVHLYSIILSISNPTPKEQVHFLYRHGLVPSVFLSGETKYVVGVFEEMLGKKQLNRIRTMPVTSEEKKIADMADVENSLFWIYLMPLTCIFMHGGWMHILSNIWFFWIFTDNVEEKMGSITFSIFYLIAGGLSSLGHVLIRPDSMVPLVGASGAVSAVMGAYVMMFPSNRITTYFCPVWFFIRRIDVPAYVVLGMYLLINFFSMTSNPYSNTAFDAHFFGFIAGLGFGYLFRNRKKAAVH